MEPLSLVANIIPLMSAAKKATQILEKLCRFRNTPQELILLVNEVADFRIIIVTLEDTISKLELQQDNPTFDAFLKELLKKGLSVIEQINSLAEPILIKDKLNPSVPSSISWRKWLRDHGNLQELCERMRRTRTELSNAMTLLTVSEVPRLRVSLENLTIGYREMESKIDAMASNVSSIGSSINALQNTAQRLQSRQSNPPSRSMHPVMQHLKVNKSSNSMIRIQTSIEPSCSALCICTCHRRKTFKSPAWLNGVIGLLFVGYTGVPLFRGHQSCSESLCRRSEKALLVLNYHFPVWFLARNIALRDQWTPTDGHMLTVRTPRVVPNSPYMAAAKAGNVAEIQHLFMQGKASPFDVLPDGTSALSLAVSYGQVNVCKFLLGQYADPHQPSSSDCKRSPVQAAYQLYLSQPASSTVIQDIYKIFEPYFNLGEMMREKGFTALHKIVIGLSPLELKPQLELSTADINRPDDQGWTPLFWAIRKYNIIALELLLEYGAATDIISYSGNTVFHVAAKASRDILELLVGTSSFGIQLPITPTGAVGFKPIGRVADDSLIELINYKNHVGSTPLCCAIYKDSVDIARLLISHGASLDLSSPVLLAVAENSHHVLEELLRSGARTDAIDADLRSILHLAGCFADLRTISILERWDLTGASIRENILGYTPLDDFDHSRPLFCHEENDLTHQRVRTAFVQLLENIGRVEDNSTHDMQEDLQSVLSEHNSQETAPASYHSEPDYRFISSDLILNEQKEGESNNQKYHFESKKEIMHVESKFLREEADGEIGMLRER